MSFLLITGRTSKVATASRGTFFCPICHHQSAYALQRVSHYFTFFFIPLFPIKTVGHYVQCQNCQAELRSEVLALTREQIEDATAPWECAACGKPNAATAQACRFCGATRVPGPPPLPGGPPGLDPLTIIMSPSPFAGAQPAGGSSFVGRILLIVAGVVVLGVFGLIALAIKSAHDARAHPELSGKKPGQEEFEKASTSILTSSGGVAHGNTPKATEMAGALSKLLGETTKDIPHMGDTDLLDPAEGKFVTFCQLNKDACAFLVHVPNLRHYSEDSKQELAKVCYAAACVVLKGGGESIRKVAVASRGALLYDRALVGPYPATKDFGGTEKLETNGSSIAGLYPFFAPEAPGEKPNADTAAAPSTPRNPETPAVASAATAPPPSTAPNLAAQVKPRPAPELRSAPAWVPIYPDLPRPPHGSGREENGVIKGRTNFETTDPLEKVKEFYENKLKADGFEITEAAPAGRLFEKAEITGKKDDGKQTLRAEIVQMKTRTIVTLIYESPAAAESSPAKQP